LQHLPAPISRELLMSVVQLSLLCLLRLLLAGAVADDASIKAFTDWFQALPGVGEVLIEPMHLTDGRRLGVKALKAIPAESVYLTVPKAALMDKNSSRASPELGPALKEAEDQGVLQKAGPRDRGTQELLLHLLYERFVKAEASFWWPYLRLLPAHEQMSVPYFLEDDILERVLNGSLLLNAVRQQRQERRAMYDAIVAPMLKNHSFFMQHAAAFSLERYEWAWAILESRSIWWSEANQPVRHLVPMLDFVNCKELQQGMRSHFTYMDQDGKAATRAAVDFAEGDEVVDFYGHANHVFFLYHGFVLEQNSVDCLLWPRKDRQLVCLHPGHAAFNEKLAADVAAVHLGQKDGSAEAIQAGRIEILQTLERRLTEYPKMEAEGQPASRREAVAVAFASIEIGLVEKLAESFKAAVARAQEL